MDKVFFYGADVCPFAYRVRLALSEKKINHEYVPVDLENKPDWFMEISPEGDVPILKYGDEIVWESNIINEFLEDAFPDIPLLPLNPVERSHARILIEYGNKKFQPCFCDLVFEPLESKHEAIRVKLHESFKYLDQELGKRPQGPYWLGENISLVDLTLYPFMEQAPVLAHYRDFELPGPDSLPHLHAWIATMKNRPSVQENTRDIEFYIEAYEYFVA
ncbi:MAG: glutathione S-transferase family protein [Rhodospirillales bacterium]|nr:glutathione S-transferase family protein [Rhodospirillales bacterium]